MSSRISIAAVSLLTLIVPRLASAQQIYALTYDNHIETFLASAPGQMLSRVPVTGLVANTQLLAIDISPVDRQVYALGAVITSPASIATSLYRIQVPTGVATRLTPTPFALVMTKDVGFGFDPDSGHIRVVTDERRNFRLNPATGTIIDGNPSTPGIDLDTNLTTAGVVAIAYRAGSGAGDCTRLFGLDSATDRIVRIGGAGCPANPSGGQLEQLGAFGVDVPNVAAFDAVQPGVSFYAALATPDNHTELFHVTPVSQTPIPIGRFFRPGGPESAVRDIAVLSDSITAFVTTTDNRLLKFKTDRPDVIITSPAISGLQPNESIVGIQMLSDGGLAAISTLGRVLMIDPVSGFVLRHALTLPFAVADGLGLDEDPATGKLRVVHKVGGNLSVDLAADTFATHTALDRQGVAAVAYLTAAGQPPTLYGLGIGDVLVRIGGPGGAPSPNGGTVTTIAPVSEPIDLLAGFEIAPASNAAYVMSRQGSSDRLFKLDLATGALDPLGTIAANNQTVTAFTLARPTFFFDASAPTPVQETPGGVTLTLFVQRLSNGDTSPFTIDYATGTGTATAGSDYTPATGTLVFLEGENRKSFTIEIKDDAEVEFAFESFPVVLTNPTGGAQIVGDAFRDVYILDNESAPNAPPTITITSPTTGPAFEAHSRFVTLSGTASDDRRVALVNWEDDRGRKGVAQGTTNWSIPSLELFDGVTTIKVYAFDEIGANATATLTITLASTFTSLLAEGATGEFFDLDILLANPADGPVEATLTFLKEDGGTVVHARTLPPQSRTTVRVDDIAGMENTTASTIVTSPSPLVVERTMRWAHGAGYGAHTEKATESASTKWYFAEGSQGFYFTYLLLANPNAAANTATVVYLRENEAPLTRTYPLAPNSRFTVDAGADSELANRSFGMVVTFEQPGIAERAMYFGLDPLWKAGHESAGVTGPATTWFLAEGATGPFFETFILLANPSADAAQVEATYLLQGGSPITKAYTVPASSRLTINIEAEDPALANAAVATRLASSVPIVVERAQYWPFAPDQWYEAHNSFGVVDIARHWGLAEGRVGGEGNHETFILLANPGAEPAEVEIQLLRTSGAPLSKTFTVAPESRLTLSTGVSGPFSELVNEEFSAVIASSEPIAVERAMYSSVGGLVWSAGTNATATRIHPIK